MSDLEKRPDGADSVADKFVSILGSIMAVRVTEKNIEKVAEWCPRGEVYPEHLLDAPEPVRYISLYVRNRHGKIVEERADVGEWVVMEDSDANYGRFSVYEDKQFLELLSDVPKLDREKAIEEITRAMKYQDHITQEGGTVEESASVVEFVVLQIENLIR